MSHFAQVQNNIVTEVIVAEQDFINLLPNSDTWIQTSYNTHANQHALGGTPVRGNFAGIGHTYDPEHDVFYAPQPYNSWQLNTTTWTWDAPVARPADENTYTWDEATLSWIQQ